MVVVVRFQVHRCLLPKEEDEDGSKFERNVTILFFLFGNNFRWSGQLVARARRPRPSQWQVETRGRQAKEPRGAHNTTPHQPAAAAATAERNLVVKRDRVGLLGGDCGGEEEEEDKKKVVTDRKWLVFVCVCVCLVAHFGPSPTAHTRTLYLWICIETIRIV